MITNLDVVEKSTSEVDNSEKLPGQNPKVPVNGKSQEKSTTGAVRSNPVSADAPKQDSPQDEEAASGRLLLDFLVPVSFCWPVYDPHLSQGNQNEPVDIRLTWIA